MPLQLLLPGFPDDSSRTGDVLSILKKDGLVTYFVGGDNYFSHRLGAVSCHRFILASLVDNGHVRACELEKAPLYIPRRTLMNWLVQLRVHGADSFFRPARRSGGGVMTPDVVARCEALLFSGLRISQVAKQMDINESTLRKAIARGAVRIHRMACPAHDAAIAALLKGVTELKFCHPETNARITYTLA